MRALVISCAVVAAAAGLSACEPALDVPREAGVCYQVLNPDDREKIDFVAVGRDQPSLEYCAARLEETRVRFARMGTQPPAEVVGVDQGQFLFLDRAGVWSARKLDGARFFMLNRTGDGRLVVPGAIEQTPE